MFNFLTKSLSIIVLMMITLSISYSSDKKYDRLLSEEQLPYLLDGSNAGTLYYLTFHPCWEENVNNNAIRIYVSSAVKTKVTLEIKDLGLTRVKETIPNDIIEFVLAPTEAQPYSKGSGSDPYPPRPEKVWTDRAIKISSEAPIVVYGVTRFQYTSDGFLALPVTSLGKVYQVASYADPTNNTAQFLPSYTSIVGVYDLTKVSFRLGGCESCSVPKESGDSLKSGQVITRTIHEGDVWLIPGIGPFNDLTGSKITADKPVAVISGNFCAYVPTHIAACDYLIEQELPEDTWGNKIYVSPIMGRKKYSIIKIFAKNPNTLVSVDNIPMWKIVNPGGVFGSGYIETRAGNTASVKPVIVHSQNDQPINVVQYNTGQADDNIESDPFQMQLTPMEQFQKEIIFNTPGIRGSFGFSSNYLNIVYKATKDGGIPDDFYFAAIIDGVVEWVPLNVYSSDPGMPFEGDSPDKNGRIYYSKTLQLPHDGVYKIKSEEPFAAYAYGFSKYDSYGFPTSIAVAALAKNDTLTPVIRLVQHNYDDEMSGEIVDQPEDDSDNRSNLSLIFMDPSTSENFKFTTEKYIANDDYKVRWKLSKINPEEISKAHLVINDRNGNRFDTIITMQSVAPNYRKSDSLALVSIYNENDGYKWINTYNWLKKKPLEEWEGVKLNDNRVVELDLSGKGLYGYLSSDAFKLSKLQNLNLSNNPLIQIPTFSNAFNELEFANLSNCGIINFPSFLLSAIKLVEVNLSNNSISSLPQGIDNNSNLIKIDVSNNKLDFADLLPYKSLINSQTFSFIYFPQNKFGNKIDYKIASADNYTINFGIDVNPKDTYSWLLDGKKLDGKNAITLIIENFDIENVGSYILKITNPDFPLLSLESQERVLSIITGKPIIVTNSIYDITENSAKIDVEIKNAGGEEIKEKGICWNNEGNPTIASNKKEFTDNSKEFVVAMDNLLANKTYYIRSYAINNQGISYSTEKYFKTSISSVDDELINSVKFSQNVDNLTITLIENEMVEYRLIDLTGNIIAFGNNGNNMEMTISTMKLSKGVYFFEMQGSTIQFSKKVIID